MVLQLTGSLERGKSYETYHSIPVEGKNRRQNSCGDYTDKKVGGLLWEEF